MVCSQPEGEKSVNPASQALVSVVTPVYNGEKYLPQCIESVLAQTYENWEYLIVNNCSTDRTLEIAQAYARRDKRIRVLNKDKLLSLVDNWNRALRQISDQSKYCKVVHADDWIFPDCLKEMVRVAEANPSVALVGAYQLRNAWVHCDGLPYPSTVIPGHEICRLILLDRLYVFGSPSSTLIRSNLVRSRGEFYKNLPGQTDLEAYYYVLQNSDFGFVHQVLTYSRMHKETITTSLADAYYREDLPETFYLLRQYGPVYLSSKEYEHRWKQLLKEYHRFLGRSVFKLRGRAFWHYHRGELYKLGHALSLARLVVGAFLEAMHVLFMPPLQTLRNQIEFVRASKKRTKPQRALFSVAHQEGPDHRHSEARSARATSP